MVALVANTAPVAFGALAVPITTLATVSGVPEHSLSQMVGRQTPILAVFVPMALVWILDKGKGVRETLPADSRPAAWCSGSSSSSRRTSSPRR